MSRIARKMYETLSVERELERAEVPVFAANEPIMLTGGRAQQILQRRINQSVAEYEVLNMLGLSWGGTCTHVREGYNIGKPCYGYKANKFRHPNPAKAEKGVTKDPPGTRRPPRGGRHSKYTGYQVYKRRARRSRGGRNKSNPPELWVWSAEAAHEPLIPKWMCDEFNARSGARKGSRDGAALKNDLRVRRTYWFRRRVLCDCGRRMIGNPRYGTTYYRCNPENKQPRPSGTSGTRPPSTCVKTSS